MIYCVYFFIWIVVIGVEMDVEIFGLGMMIEDEDSVFMFDDEDGEVLLSFIEMIFFLSNGNGIFYKCNSIF